MYRLLFIILVILYDCSQLAGCCSSCVATTIQTGYECGWCSGMNACSIVEECIGTATQIAWFAARSIDCPLPVITYVHCNDSVAIYPWFWVPK